MSTVFGNQCAQCRADIIAAAWSEHLSDSCVRNVWACDAQFEDTVFLSAREAADAPEGRARMDGFVASIVIAALAIIALGGAYSAWRHY